jgi:hypothetical protein
MISPDLKESLRTDIERAAVAAGELKTALGNYFTLRAKSDNEETTLYTDTLERFAP